MINPYTGSEIKKDGVVYKKLLDTGFVLQTKNGYEFLKPPVSGFIKTPRGHYIDAVAYHKKNKTPLYNPDTGKLINFATAKKKSDYTLEYYGMDVRMIPKDKINYEKTKELWWIKKGTKAFTQLKNEDKLLIKEVYLPNLVNGKPRMIPLDSPQFAELIHDGFTYDEKINLLQYPRYETIVEFKKCSNNDVKQLLDENPHTISLYVDGNITIINTRNPDDIATLVNKLLHYNGGDDISLRGVSGGEYVKFGIAFDGIANCVISELDKHCQLHNYGLDHVLQRLYIRYRHGVYGNDYNDIAKALQLSIVVHYPPYSEESVVVFPKGRKMKRATFDCAYQNHHITSRKSTINYRDKPVVWEDNISIDNFNICEIVNVGGRLEHPNQIELEEMVHRRRYEIIIGDNGEEFKIDYELYNTNTAIGHFTKMFIANNRLNTIHNSHMNIDAIKSICQHGIMFQRKNDSRVHNYDLKKAYTTYEKCKYYTGFPADLTYCVYVKDMCFDKIMDLVKNNEGFAMVKMTCIWTMVEIERWVSLPYLRFYINGRKAPVTIFYLMLSNNQVNLNLDSLDIQKRIWHKVLGNTNRTRILKTYCTTDGVLAGSTVGAVDTIDILDKKEHTLSTLFRKHVNVDKVCSNYLPYLAGYVQNYTEIRLETLVLSSMKEEDVCSNIVKVWVDGIYSTKELKLCEEEWHYNIEELETDDVQINYKCKAPVYFGSTFNNLLINYDSNHHIITGGAGTGKSYNLNQLYKQTPNSIILVPNHDLKNNYPDARVETLDKVLELGNKVFSSYRHFFVDEYSKISQEKIDKLFTVVDVQTLVLAGDVEQLRLFNGTAIDEGKFNVIILEMIYRQHDKTFQEKLNALRKGGGFKFDNNIDPKSAINRKFIILSSTHAEIDKLNKLGLALNDNKLTHGIKRGSPVRFYKTTTKYNAGETGVITSIDDKIIAIKKDNGVIVEIRIDDFIKHHNTKDRHHKLAYSMTYHAVQGRTVIGKNIAINTKNLFDNNMKYVGCSRVVNESQLFLLVGDGF
jgi:hypothetical protein